MTGASAPEAPPEEPDAEAAEDDVRRERRDYRVEAVDDRHRHGEGR